MQTEARKAGKKPRHKIPAEGLQFVSHAELRAHFSARYLEDLANTKKSTKRIEAKVDNLERKIIQLVAKLSKYSERLGAGKILAKRHYAITD